MSNGAPFESESPQESRNQYELKKKRVIRAKKPKNVFERLTMVKKEPNLAPYEANQQITPRKLKQSKK